MTRSSNRPIHSFRYHPTPPEIKEMVIVDFYDMIKEGSPELSALAIDGALSRLADAIADAIRGELGEEALSRAVERIRQNRPLTPLR